MAALATTRQIGVIGAGTMGAGIAQVAAAAGHSVILFDTFEGAAARGKAKIEAGLQRLVTKGKLTSDALETLLARISIGMQLGDLADAGLIVEAIVEDLAVKRALFAALEDLVAPDTILASNTSSISITAIARDLARPQQMVGMHFFNPAPVMKLVEVISGVATRPEVADCVAQTATAWGKVAVMAKSTPGFIVNRVARAYYAEALRLSEEQLADPATIDALMVEGAGFRMGPFALMDLIGHDVNYAVSKSVFDAYYQEPRFRPSILQLELVNAGRLGQKTGQGFYDHRDGAQPVVPKTEALVAGAMPLAAFTLGEGYSDADLHIAPSDGRRAAQLAQDMGKGVILYDLIAAQMAGAQRAGSRLAFAASEGVTPAQIAAFVASLDQLGIRATQLRDWPGLVALRSLACLANEGFEAVLQGVADEKSVDQAMIYGVNYPKGPMAWAREIGLMRILKVLESLQHLTGDPRYRASMALRLAAEQV